MDDRSTNTVCIDLDPLEGTMSEANQLNKSVNETQETQTSTDIELEDNRVETKLPLHEAVIENSIEKLNSLLESATPDILSSKNKENKTALHLAVEQRRIQCFESIIKKSTVVLSDKDDDFNTPLHYIAKIGFVEACEIVAKVASKKIWNVINRKNEMPVHIAARENKIKVLELMIQSGAKVDPKSKNGHTPLHYACDNGNNECVNIIVQSIKDLEERKRIINAQTKSKSTPLILAADKGYSDCCKQLVDANINIPDNSGQTALHYAARRGYLDLVKYLLNLNPKLHHQSRNGQTALSCAASGQNEEVFNLLLKRTGEIDDDTGTKLLEILVKNKSVECLEMLLKNKNLHHLINHAPKGNTLLHVSLTKGNYKITKLLLETGADKNICNKDNNYPLHLAANQKKLESRYQEEERLEVTKMILKHSHELVHKVNNKNETPLHLAAKFGNVEMIRSLIPKGAKLMAKDDNKHTVVHVASKEGHQEALKKILKELKPENIQELHKMERHPLHLAAKYGHLECCKLIIKYLKMKTIAVKDSDQFYPVDLAYKNKKFETFRYLLAVMKYEPEHESFCCRLHKYCEDNIKENNEEVVEAIVHSKWFAVAFDSLYCPNVRDAKKEEKKKCQSLEKLSIQNPDLVCLLFDQFITKSSTGGEMHNYIAFENIYYSNDKDGSFVSPFESENEKFSRKPDSKELDGVIWGKDHPLKIASKLQDHRILTHKLTKSWLDCKFEKYIRYILYIYLVIDFFSASFTTAFVSRLWNTNHLRDNFHTGYTTLINGYKQNYQMPNATFTSSNCSDYCNISLYDHCESNPSNTTCLQCSYCISVKLSTYWSLTTFLQVACFLFLAFHLYVEQWIFAVLYKRRGNPIKCIKPVMLLRLIFLTAILIPSSNCDSNLGLRHVFHWQMGVNAVLVSWLCFISTVNKVPSLSILMPFNMKFFKTYLKVLLNIGLLVFSFALCFQFLLPQNKVFQNTSNSIVKTLVWILGDLGYEDTFLPDGGQLDYPLHANLLFVIFILGIGSVAFNMIIRDSFDAIESYRTKSAFYQASAVLSLHLLIDDCFPQLRRKYAVARRKIRFGKKKSHYLCGKKQSNIERLAERMKSAHFFSQKNAQTNSILMEVDQKFPSEKSECNDLLSLVLSKLEEQSVKFHELNRRLEKKDDGSQL